MNKNTITVRSYLVNGNVIDILENAPPNEAIETYFSPDTRPPVQTLEIDVITNDLKRVTISISSSSITATIV